LFLMFHCQYTEYLLSDIMPNVETAALVGLFFGNPLDRCKIKALHLVSLRRLDGGRKTRRVTGAASPAIIFPPSPSGICIALSALHAAILQFVLYRRSWAGIASQEKSGHPSLAEQC
jgi:hypothetical protein